MNTTTTSRTTASQAARSLRRRLHAHAWTTAAGFAAVALTLVETAGGRNP